MFLSVQKFRTVKPWRVTFIKLLKVEEHLSLVGDIHVQIQTLSLFDMSQGLFLVVAVFCIKKNLKTAAIYAFGILQRIAFFRFVPFCF